MTQTIFITGASSGIGKATAKYFQEKGWNVVATMRSPEKETELGKLSHTLVTKLDVTDRASIDAAYKVALSVFHKVDVVLNNAGYGAYGPFEAASADAIERQFNTNVLGAIAVTKAFLPHFRENKSGIIINISSIGGKSTFPLFSLYNGTKFAIEGFSEGLSYELKPCGIKVKIIEPGAIATDFSSRSMAVFNDENLLEYQSLVDKMNSAFANIDKFFPIVSSPALVAQVIYEAATDNTDTLRYTAGEDARELMKLRAELDDNEFFSTMQSQFGLK